MTTLLQLRTRCKEESDNVNQSFISDAEWDKLINSSYQEVYGLVAETYGADYFTQSPSTGYTFLTDGINQFFALPATFFKLLGVDVQVSSPQQWVTLKRFAFADRNRLSVFNNPIPMAGQTVRVFFVPRVTVLAADADVISDAISMNGWEEYIIADACIKAMAKEESDVSVLMERKQKLLKRIESESENRDAANPPRIVDVTGRRAQAMQYRLNGSNLWLIGNSAPGWLYGGGDWGGDDGGAWGGY